METSPAVCSSNPKTSSQGIRPETGMKMMTKCIVCSTRYRPSTNLCFFNFPTDIKRKIVWMEALNLKAPIKNWYKICNKHFKNDQFVCCKRRNKLLPTAVPFSPLSCEKYVPRDLPSSCSPTLIDLTSEEDVQHNFSSSCVSSSSNNNNYKKKLPQSFSLSHAPLLQDHVYAKEKIPPLSLPSISSVDHDYVKKATPSLSSCVPSTLNNPNYVKKATPSLSSCVPSTLDKPNYVKKTTPSLSSCVPSTLDNPNGEPKIVRSLLTFQVPKTLRRYITLSKEMPRPLKSVSSTESIDELPLPKQTIQNLNSNKTENVENTYSSTPKKRKNCSVENKISKKKIASPLKSVSSTTKKRKKCSVADKILNKQIASPLKSFSSTECIDELPLPKQTIQDLNSNMTENLENTNSSTPKKRKKCSVADKMCNLKKKNKLVYQKYNNLHSKYKRLNKMFCDHLKHCNMPDVLFD